MRELALIVLCSLFAAIAGTSLAVNVHAQKRPLTNNNKNSRTKKQQPNRQIKQESQAAVKHTSKSEVKHIDKPTETTTLPVRTPQQQVEFQRLIAKAQSEGTVKITVGVGAGFTLEGELSESQRQLQRTGIATAQDQLLSLLNQFKVVLVFKDRFIPYMTITVNANALIFMRDSLLVTFIRGDDAIVEPALQESTALIGMPNAWNRGCTGAGQAIAILDTGVDKNDCFLRRAK